MKKVILLLLLGVSTVSFASVAPVNSSETRVPTTSHPDATKMKMMVRQRPLKNSVGAESIAELKRYNGILTMDNVNAIENMSRLMQDDPDRLMQELTGASSDDIGFAVDRRKMGTNEIVGEYERSPETDDPAVKLAGLNTPDLTGSFSSVRHSEEEIKAMHRNALKQIEEIGHNHLGQKTAPIQMRMTVEDIKAMGIDTRRLPRGWEDAVREREKNLKKHQEYEKHEKGKKEDVKVQTVQEVMETVKTQQKSLMQPQPKTVAPQVRRTK